MTVGEKPHRPQRDAAAADAQRRRTRLRRVRHSGMAAERRGAARGGNACAQATFDFPHIALTVCRRAIAVICSSGVYLLDVVLVPVCEVIQPSTAPVLRKQIHM